VKLFLRFLSIAALGLAKTAHSPIFRHGPFFAGLYQLNAQIPQITPTGVAVQSAIRMGPAVSNSVTIAVQ